MFLKAMELCEDGTKQWVGAAASAFDQLKNSAYHEVPKPEWWNDEALKALSAQVVAVSPDGDMLCAMRARVLSGGALAKAHWNAGPRTAAEIKEAASWYRRAARVCHLPLNKELHEQCASQCDEYADPLLAEEEAEAAQARATAQAEAAEVLKVAETKAAAAAEELLAAEEKQKQQASAKGQGEAGQG